MVLTRFVRKQAQDARPPSPGQASNQSEGRLAETGRKWHRNHALIGLFGPTNSCTAITLRLQSTCPMQRCTLEMCAAVCRAGAFWDPGACPTRESREKTFRYTPAFAVDVPYAELYSNDVWAICRGGPSWLPRAGPAIRVIRPQSVCQSSPKGGGDQDWDPRLLAALLDARNVALAHRAAAKTTRNARGSVRPSRRKVKADGCQEV